MKKQLSIYRMLFMLLKYKLYIFLWIHSLQYIHKIINGNVGTGIRIMASSDVGGTQGEDGLPGNHEDPQEFQTHL